MWTLAELRTDLAGLLVSEWLDPGDFSGRLWTCLLASGPAISQSIVLCCSWRTLTLRGFRSGVVGAVTQGSSPHDKVSCTGTLTRGGMTLNPSKMARCNCLTRRRCMQECGMLVEHAARGAPAFSVAVSPSSPLLASADGTGACSRFKVAP